VNSLFRALDSLFDNLPSFKRPLNHLGSDDIFVIKVFTVELGGS